MQRSGARARIKGEVFLPVFTEHAEEKVAERCVGTLDGQAQERHRMPMPRIGPVPERELSFFPKRPAPIEPDIIQAILAYCGIKMRTCIFFKRHVNVCEKKNKKGAKQ